METIGPNARTSEARVKVQHMAESVGRKDGATVTAAGAHTSWLAALSQRVASALVLIPIVIALVFFGGWIAYAGAVVALILGAYELHDMLRHGGWRPLSLIGVGVSIMFLTAARVLALSHDRSLVFFLLGGGISLLLVVPAGWLILTRRSFQGAVLDWALTLVGAIYLGWPLACFIILRGDHAGVSTSGFWWLLATFFMVWTDDTFALLTGHYFGRHKLAPHISPGKTWEGFYGGLAFTVVAALVFVIALPNAFGHPLNVAWYHAVILGVLVAIASTIGDLAESLLKRATGVKDSGKLVPGHGGILDRMDSLLFAVLVVLFYAAFLNAVAI